MSDVMFGFGAMRLDLEDGNDESSINFKDFAEMIDYYMDQGFNYFDTSFAYHEGQSEIGLREGLVKRYPRESFKIADKMPTWLLQSEEDNEKYMNIMLERLGVDYFDVFIIHNINPAFYQIALNCKTFEFIKKMKDEGKAKKIGFSYHDRADLLEEILEKYGDMIDVVQLQLNYLDWESNLTESRKNYEVCEKYGKEVVVMEPIKGGTLFNLPEDIREKFESEGMSLVEAALRFAGSPKNVSVVLSGM
ncbi:MAG: aldo/keto reductase [Methanobrevibacter sp.]|nr:aldo/keto reductase [Methanobrevibacter sp.]